MNEIIWMTASKFTLWMLVDALRRLLDRPYSITIPRIGLSR
jgi:hypothetical protein